MFKCKYFILRELVSPIVYNKYGDFAWSFFDEDILKELDLIRKLWGSAIIINNWSFRGAFSQSGYRCNADQLLAPKNEPYCSAHTMGKGFDLKDHKGRNKELHAFIWGMMQQGKLKAFKRMEHLRHTPTWVHIDSFQTKSGKPEIFTL